MVVEFYSPAWCLSALMTAIARAWSLIATATCFVFGLVTWPLTFLIGLLLWLLAPVKHVIHFVFWPFVQLLRIVQGLEPLYIFLGTAAFLGLLAGLGLKLTSGTFVTVLKLGDSSDATVSTRKRNADHGDYPSSYGAESASASSTHSSSRSSSDYNSCGRNTTNSPGSNSMLEDWTASPEATISSQSCSSANTPSAADLSRRRMPASAVAAAAAAVGIPTRTAQFGRSSKHRSGDLLRETIYEEYDLS